MEKMYKVSKVNMNSKESNIRMYVVLDKELTTYDGFRFEPGQWNEGPDKSGLLVWMNKPDYHLIHYIPNRTYLVEEVEQLLGGDSAVVRYKKVRISARPLSLDDLLGRDKEGFCKAYLSGADLSGADLSQADLSEADLSKANLFGAYLPGAHLSKANLSGAYLYKAYLSGAHLSQANLSGAYLNKANLSEAYLSGAHLSGANFFIAHGVKNNSNLSIKQRDAAHC